MELQSERIGILQKYVEVCSMQRLFLEGSRLMSGIDPLGTARKLPVRKK
jgi:hypothetical protein